VIVPLCCRVLLLAACAGCGFQAADRDGGGGDVDLGVDDLAGADLTGVDLAQPAGCRALVLPCLDPAPANVIEVPGESTAQNAFMTAKTGDTIQIKGLQLGAGFRVPAGVTLRGCSGAQIVSTIAFVGTTGIIEGFTVPGSIIANTSGNFTIRYNRFTGSSTTEYGVSARAVDGIVGATVNATIDSNLFEKRSNGVEARTTYDTMTRKVTLTVRNNLFTLVDKPVNTDEGGLVGVVDLSLEYNTFADFKTAVRLSSLTNPAHLSANLFAFGDIGVDGDSAYDISQDHFHMVTTHHVLAPTTGAALTGDPQFVGRANGDLRLGPASPLIDALPPSFPGPAVDYFGCPRPARGTGDPGAIEAQ
jgi:hypothetical protein